jgi:hypothetical protein
VGGIGILHPRQISGYDFEADPFSGGLQVCMMKCLHLQTTHLYIITPDVYMEAPL